MPAWVSYRSVDRNEISDRHEILAHLMRLGCFLRVTPIDRSEIYWDVNGLVADKTGEGKGIESKPPLTWDMNYVYYYEHNVTYHPRPSSSLSHTQVCCTLLHPLASASSRDIAWRHSRTIRNTSTCPLFEGKRNTTYISPHPPLSHRVREWKEWR